MRHWDKKSHNEAIFLWDRLFLAFKMLFLIAFLRSSQQPNQSYIKNLLRLRRSVIYLALFSQYTGYKLIKYDILRAVEKR
jgi:hypothetical protein